MRIREEQIEHFVSRTHQDFLLVAICDWFAIYRQVYGTAPRTLFEDAWDLGDYVLEKLEGIQWNQHSDCVYEILHQTLSAVEKGVPDDVLDRALALFCTAMPSDEAGLALLTMELRA